MSGANGGDETDSDLVTVTFQVTESFLEGLDDTWQDRGFKSRNQFIEYTLRDAVRYPTFDRDELIAFLQAEDDIQKGRTMSSEKVRSEY